MTGEASTRARTISPQEKARTISMSIGNVQLIHECSSVHLRVRTTRMENTKEEVKIRVNIWKEIQRTRKKSSPVGLTTAQAYRPLGVSTLRTVDELPNEPNLHL